MLVVDDHEDARVALSDVLRAYGYTVFEAHDADQALSVLAAQPSVSAVLTDVEMPGAMDGVGLAEAVGSVWPNIKIIVLSADEAHGQRLSATVPFFRKPCTVDALLQQLDALVRTTPLRG